MGSEGNYVQKRRRQKEGSEQATDDEQGAEKEVDVSRPHAADAYCSLPMRLSTSCPEIVVSLIAIGERLRPAGPSDKPSSERAGGVIVGQTIVATYETVRAM
ncbi:MAG: hypothetical protein M3506_07265 [Chloroflexota bacterium]|nr:hypothetical protein [Chloroflexota bacterium]